MYINKRTTQDLYQFRCPAYLHRAMDFKTKGRLSWLAYLLYSIRNRGLMRTCSLGYREWLKERELGINTLGTSMPQDRTLSCDDGGGGHLYQPSSSVLFQKAIKALPVSPGGRVLLDVGSGKGRALILAAQAGFSKVIGIEYATELNDMAHVNIEKVRSRFPDTVFELHDGDATDFGLPADVDVIYLFNPFDEQTLLKWSATIAQQLQRPIHVIYMHPVFAEALTSSHPTLLEIYHSPDDEFIIYRLG